MARTIIQLQDNGLMSSVKSVQQEQTKIRKAMALQDHKHIYIYRLFYSRAASAACGKQFKDVAHLGRGRIQYLYAHVHIAARLLPHAASFIITLRLQASTSYIYTITCMLAGRRRPAAELQVREACEALPAPASAGSATTALPSPSTAWAPPRPAAAPASPDTAASDRPTPTSFAFNWWAAQAGKRCSPNRAALQGNSSAPTSDADAGEGQGCATSKACV